MLHPSDIAGLSNNQEPLFESVVTPRMVVRMGMDGQAKAKRGRPQGSPNKVNHEVEADKLRSLLDLMRMELSNISENSRNHTIHYTLKGKEHTLTGNDINLLYLKLADTLGKSAPKQLVQDAISYLANENAFDPIVDWLNECRSVEPLGDGEWKNLGQILWSADDDIANTIMQRTFIQGVARAFNPGCTADWVPIAVGGQGLGKSYTWELISPLPEYHGEISQSLNELEKERSILHGNFINVLEEGDRLVSGKGSNAEGFKNLVSVKVDEYRKPYATDPIKQLRAFILVMTSNRHDFIADAESRRTLPIRIPSTHVVPEQWIKANLRRIWARAIAEYDKGTRYLFTRKEIQENLEYLNGFRTEDPVESVLDAFLRFHTEVQAHHVVEHCLQLPRHLQERKHTRRITDMLKSRGWEQKATTRKIDGESQKVRLWVRPKGTAATPTPDTDF